GAALALTRDGARCGRGPTGGRATVVDTRHRALRERARVRQGRPLAGRDASRTRARSRSGGAARTRRERSVSLARRTEAPGTVARVGAVARAPNAVRRPGSTRCVVALSPGSRRLA